MDVVENIRSRFGSLSPHLDEQSLRLSVASGTPPLGRGGVSLVSTATGVARSTIYRGLAEAHDAQVEPMVRKDPGRSQRWVSKSLRHLAASLTEQGYSVSHTLVGRLLKRQGYTFQGNVQTG